MMWLLGRGWVCVGERRGGGSRSLRGGPRGSGWSRCCCWGRRGRRGRSRGWSVGLRGRRSREVCVTLVKHEYTGTMLQACRDTSRTHRAQREQRCVLCSRQTRTQPDTQRCASACFDAGALCYAPLGDSIPAETPCAAGLNLKDSDVRLWHVAEDHQEACRACPQCLISASQKVKLCPMLLLSTTLPKNPVAAAGSV